MKDRLIARIVASYDDPVVRLYSRIRFVILRERFLDEIGQYLPSSGHVVDVGCGFGLFALYFAASRPGIHVHGIDLSQRRVAWARAAARRLDLGNVDFEVCNARHFVCDVDLQGAYMIDMIHHIPPGVVRPLIEHLVERLNPDTRLIIKDVDSSPFPKMAFTWLLDKLVDMRAPVRYWPHDEVLALLGSLGMVAHRHALVDILPYPHMIYIGHKVVTSRVPAKTDAHRTTLSDQSIVENSLRSWR
jgi:2-polyprenyl-3-methyl-5-hydroxy-6-metoxy-1,4-benzoquinol methylase